MRFPFSHQLTASDCGPTCIYMITKYYGKNIDIKYIRDLCDVMRQGVTALDIVNCLRKLKFESKGAFISKSSQLREIPLPVILFWKQEHFVILYEIRKNKRNEYLFYVADPAFGLLKLGKSQFDKLWLNGNKGLAILMHPREDFYRIQNLSEKRKTSFSQIFKLFHGIIKENSNKYTLSAIFVFLSILLNWLIPVVLQRIIDYGVLKKDLNVVWELVIFQLFLFCGYTISESLSSIMLTKINFDESIKYIGKYLYKLTKLPIKFFDSRLNTDLIQRIGDQETLQNFLTNKFLEFFFTILNLLVFSAILCYYNYFSFSVFLTFSGVSIIWTLFFLKKRKRLDYDRFSINSENKNNIYEVINGMAEIKVNNAQNVVISKWQILQNQLNKISLDSLYLNYYQLIGSSFVNKLKDIIITFICAYLVIKNNLSLGVMMTIGYVLGQLSAPVIQITSFIQVFQDAKIALERLEDIQMRKDEDDNTKMLPPLLLNRGIRLSHVCFKYMVNSKKYVINNLSLSIPTGKITAIVGVSGSGKTTLAKLLLSFYYPQSGDIFLDDVRLNEVNSNLWREKCGVVMQNGIIFSGTISENIALHDYKPDIKRVKLASKIACVDEFIENLPLGYNTKIGNSGIDLSGGQKQRILIARAVYKNPQFIIMDEATSSLDANNEMKILNNLSRFFEGKTVVIIAHRLSTVKNANNIVVMERGTIVEEGTHRMLTSLKGVYYHLVKNQLELGN